MSLIDEIFQENDSIFGETDNESIEEYEGVDTLEFSGGDMESPFSEEEEIDLAAELLSVADEAELDQFLGSLISKASKAVKGFVKSPVGRALGGILRKAAKIAVPIAGRALGTVIGGPVGGMIGGKLADTAANIFGLELEGLSPEDRDFESARRFVRLAGVSVNNVMTVWPVDDPQTTANEAMTNAARKYAPGLIRNNSAKRPIKTGVSKTTGRWIQRGNRIFVLGV